MSGGNGYAVQDGWIKHQQEQRKRDAARRAELQEQRDKSRRDLADKIRARMPDMVDEAGNVDGFAVYAAHMLTAEGKDATPRAIRERRAAHRMYDGRTLADWEKETDQ